MTLTTLRTAFADAVCLSRILADWCRTPDAVTPAEMNGLIERLADCTEALPPTVADLLTMVQLRNRLRAVRVYLQVCECGAARHEAEQLHRKLIRLPV